MPNAFNDILIRQFKKSFELNTFQAGLIQSAFYMGYFLLALPAALVMKKFSYKIGLVVGLMLFGTGCWLFYPAATRGTYEMFLIALFVIASGLAFLETGANSYITVLGDPDMSERRLNFSQAFNPLGVIIALLIGTIFIFSGIELKDVEISAMQARGEYQAYLDMERMRVVVPYIVLGTVVILWAVLILVTKFPSIPTEKEHGTKGSLKALFGYRHFKLGVVAQFLCVGAQVGIWSYFIQYAQDYTGQPEKVAGFFLTGTLVAFAIGRFSATYLMRYVSPGKMMGMYATVNVVLVSIAVVLPGWVGFISLFMTSFFMSIMFPTIFALGVKGLGPNTKLGGSFIIMAIVGGAIFPPLMGLVQVTTGMMSLSFVIPLLSYLFIIYYSNKGSVPVRKELLADTVETSQVIARNREL